MTGLRIAFIGDSFVNGTGDDECLGWSGRLCAAARRRGRDVTLYNLGVRRDTSADVAARWEREARARLPDGVNGRLVFSFGVNDCVEEEGRPRLTEDGSVAAARSILSTASAWRPTLMVGPPPGGEEALNARIARLSSRLAALCGELGVPYMPVLDPLLASPDWVREARAGDGAHPGARGYAALATLVSAWPPWRDGVTATEGPLIRR